MSLPDWITAISTASTAVVSAVAAWAAIRTYRQAEIRSGPIIEATTRWDSHSSIGRHIVLSISIVNRLDETLDIHSVAILFPQGTKLSRGQNNTEYSGGPTIPSAGTSKSVVIDKAIQPTGSSANSPDAALFRDQRTDMAHIQLYATPPDRWMSGKLLIEVYYSSRAATFRNKRVIISKRVTAWNSTMTEQKASNEA